MNKPVLKDIYQNNRSKNTQETMKTKAKQTRGNPIRQPLLALTLAAGLLALRAAQAATGTWNTDGDGLWSNSANWSGTVPGAVGDIANLTYPISAPRVITTDVSRSLGILNLADSLAPGYTLTNNSGITLTLNNRGAGAQINQTGDAAASDLIATPIKLADNLFVTNNSQLTFSGVISGTGFGLTKAGSGTVTSTTADTFTGAVVVNGGTLLFGPGGAINGAASLAINNGGTVQFDANGNSDNIGNHSMPIIVNSGGTLAVTAKNSMGYDNLNNYANITLNNGTFSLSAVQYIGTITLNGGTVDGASAMQFWYSVPVAINCSNNASILAPININNSSQTISVAGGAILTVSGTISFNGASGFTKIGAGTLALTGASPGTGTTTVGGGTLQMDGGLGSGAVTVMSGGSLTGIGTINGPVTVQAGGMLAPGDAGIGTLTINNSLALATGSTNILKLSKTGDSLISDSIQGLSSATYGGVLIVTNIASDSTALANGDTVQLFSAGAYAGGFSTLILPVLPAGLSWDASQLAVNGFLTVSSAVGTPAFNPPAGNFPGPMAVTISSLTPGATIYYTTDGSTPTTSSPHGVTPVTVTVLGSSPSETLTAYGVLVGHADSGFNSAAYTSSLSSWTNTAGGNWSDSQNWLYNVVANGGGITADFSTLSLAGDTSVTNDAGPTVGSMIFADRGNSHGWTVVDHGAGAITLDNGANPPVITVSNQTATIATSLAGTSGLTKMGNGTLALTGANTYTGTTTVGAGTLNFGSSIDTYATSPLAITAGAVAAASGTVKLDVNQNGGAPSQNVAGDGTLRLVATTNSASSPDLYFAPDQVSYNYYGAIEAAALDLGGQQRFVYGLTGHNGVGRYGIVNADCVFAGSIRGAGGLTIIAQNNWTAQNPMEVPFCLLASNSFAGPLEIQRGSVYLGNASALTQTNVLFMNANSGNSARFFLYGNSVAVANLSSTSNGTNVIANGNELSAAALTLGAVTLTVNQTTSGTYSGMIQDVLAEYDGSGSGTTGPLNLTKTGPGTLTLSGANSYSGATTIAGGALLVNGSLGTGTVTVSGGATLGGTGVIGGTTTVQSGGTLTPGNNGLGSLCITNALTLAAGSMTTLAIDRTAGTASYGNVAGLATATFGGTLTVASLGGAFQLGDSFQLFSSGSGNNFTATNLPNISPLKWNWNPAAGTLSVVSAVNPTPTNVMAVATNGSLQLSWPADHVGWRLLVQTNHLSTGISASTNDWTTVPGSSATNREVVPFDATKPAEFYRLVYP